MPTDPGEIRRLRSALRDLVALSTIPAAWVGREPAMIAAGLADALVGSLRLDFVFVRLCDPAGGAAIDVTRGDGWKKFPEWLQCRLDAPGHRWYKEIIPDVGGGAERCPGLVIPIEINADGGLVAVACARADFPTETDQLLLSVAANHAAVAFQGARLIHERRRAEEQLRKARDELELKVAERTSELRRIGAELQTILDASPVGMVLLRQDHTVQRCNPAFERLLGWTAEEIVGRRNPLLERIEERQTPLLEMLERGQGFSGLEGRIMRKDGAVFDAALACAPLIDEQGRPGLVANVVDISDRKRVEEKLRKARAELAHVTRMMTLGELAGSIAHEINQPLTAIVADAAASLMCLAKPNPDLDLVREALGDIATEGHRAADVLRRIRQLAAKRDPQKTRLDLNDVIHDAVALVRNEVHKHRASLRVALAPALPAAFGDCVQLQQVIINLVMNGVEAMEGVEDRPRELVIRSAAQEGDRVLVAVQDAGVGFDPKHVHRLFNAFFTTKPTGMGIGLSISRSIIEEHGGHLWATPNSAHGATFQFALPVMR
jgi:PAS domain S-box-containing protein